MGKRLKWNRVGAAEVAELPTFAARSWWGRRGPIWLLGGMAALAGAVWALGRETGPATYGYQVVNAFPHDRGAYCQGLVFSDGTLYEGTGEYGKSTLRKVELETGNVLQSVALNARYFGEGITVWKDRIIQLTWKNEIGIVYDRETLAEKQRFRIAGQGWGLTHDGQHLILSDGSYTLRFLDPQTFQVVRRLNVQSQGRKIRNLNELEYINGQIFANVWHQDYIVAISPRNGEVLARIDLRGILPDSDRLDSEAVLNGIAFDAKTDRLFVTGKNWPKLFEIRVKPRS